MNEYKKKSAKLARKDAQALENLYIGFLQR